jgi:hypothetical protein
MLATSSWDVPYYETFYLNTVFVAIFIISVLLSLKYEKYKKTIGFAQIFIGVIEAMPYTGIIFISLLTRTNIEFNVAVFLLIIGLITIAGGVATFNQAKPRWKIFLIIVAITQLLWTVIHYFT